MLSRIGRGAFPGQPRGLSRRRAWNRLGCGRLACPAHRLGEDDDHLRARDAALLLAVAPRDSEADLAHTFLQGLDEGLRLPLKDSSQWAAQHGLRAAGLHALRRGL